MKTRRYISRKIYKEGYSVEFGDVDTRLRMTPQRLLTLVELRNARHVEFCKMGNPSISHLNLVWVIARLKAIFIEDVKCDHEISVVTLAGKVRKIFYPRYTLIKDEEGNDLARVNIVWSLFDIKNRRISFFDVRKTGDAPIESEEELVEFPSKLEVFEPTDSFKYTPRYHDFDSNGHVNNMKYLDWIYDYLGMDYIVNHRLKELQIDFYQEIREFKEVLVELRIENDLVKAQIKNDGNIVVSLVLDFVAI